MAYNALRQLTDNIAATRVALSWHPGVTPDATQMDQLRRYSGFGGIMAVLYGDGSRKDWERQNATEADMRLYDPMMGFYELLQNHLDEPAYKDVLHSLKSSALTAFYTPVVIPQTLFTTLLEQGVRPTRLYEPSAGAGIFIRGAEKYFPNLDRVTSVEKDILTGKVLQAVLSGLPVPGEVHIKGFEEAPVADNGEYDFIVSNIPFGNFAVYDPAYPDKNLSGRIHNYFFAKGLDKIGNGGLLAYITSNGFLDSPGNRAAREYLFSRSDFVSLSVMPDNLMKETGNTESPSHLLIVQKHEGKEGLSEEERLLMETVDKVNEFGHYTVNQYVERHPEILLGDEIWSGKDQYGDAHQVVWQNAPLEGIAKPLTDLLNEGLVGRLNREALERLQLSLGKEESIGPARRVGMGQILTFLEPPETKQIASVAQGGLFDEAPSEAASRGASYLTAEDEAHVQPSSAKILATIRTVDRQDHESLVLVTAKTAKSNKYRYKLYSNVREINVSKQWFNGEAIRAHLEGLAKELKKYDHQFRYIGDPSLETIFTLGEDAPTTFRHLKSFYKDQTLVVHRDKVGLITEVDQAKDQATFTPTDLPERDLLRLERYIEVRDSYFDLFNRENIEQREYPELRGQLNEQYDRFVVNYGVLNAPANQHIFAQDVAFGAILPSSLERREGDQFVKADILRSSLFDAPKLFTTDDPLEAMARCLNDRGKVDIGYIAEMTNRSAYAAIEALGNHIYVNPVSGAWETNDQYLSGNVVEKLKLAKEQVTDQPDDPQLQRSLEAIQSVQPEPVPFELVTFNLGERWIPMDYYTRFATDLFEQKATVVHLESGDRFLVDTAKSGKAKEEYAIKSQGGHTMYGSTLLEHALENTAPHFSYEIDGPNGEKIRMVDNQATQLAYEKIEAIRTQFSDWLKRLPEEDKVRITKLYNDTFNCIVLREYNGDHLTFPGLDKKASGIKDDLYPSQKSGVWRIIQDRGALLDHQAGLGKTLTLCVAAHEMKRLGIIQKPMIAGLKNNTSEIADTYKKAYPADRVLFPRKEDFSPKNRQRLFLEIKNNQWDCVIITHDQFGMIQQAPEIQKMVLSEELDDLERDLEVLHKLGGETSKRELKGLEKRKEGLTVKLKEATAKIERKTDHDISFRDLGIDHLFVDESHKFKNLLFTTRHTRVAGLGNQQGSQRALNMLFALRDLQNRFDQDLCATFASGTPISNSLTELYLLFKYLKPGALKRQGIKNFDSWAAAFAIKSVEFEFSVTNQIIAKERFRHFKNVIELSRFYNEFADYKTAKHINLDRPESKEDLVVLKPTPEQEAYIEKLIEFARTGDATLIGRSPLSQDEDRSRMLIAMNEAKKLAVDIRLISDRFEDHPDNKVNTCARRMAEIYQQSSPYKGTQIFFCDIGTPKPGKFNVYDALRDKLVQDFGIPPYEITFMHEWSDEQRPELFRKMNSGEIRILGASSQRGGTGTNVQKLLIAEHHLDVPLKPSDLEQRIMRAVRQGNWLAKNHYDNQVNIFIYATERSLDGFNFNLLKHKQIFLDQFKNSNLNVRIIDEGAMDEQGALNFSDYASILMGDTSLLEKSKLERKIAVLESSKMVHYREIGRARQRLEDLQTDRKKLMPLMEKLTIDQKLYKSGLELEKDGTRKNPIHLANFSGNDPESVGRFLIDYFYQYRPEEPGIHEKKIGDLYGFDLYIKTQTEQFKEGYAFHTQYYAMNPESGIKYTYTNGQPNVDNPKLAARYFLEAIAKVDALQEKHLGDLTRIDQDIPLLTQLKDRVFEREDELKGLKIELSQLDIKIALKLRANSAEEKTDQGRVTVLVGADQKESSDNATQEAEVVNSKIHIDPRVKGLLIRTAVKPGTTVPGSKRRQGVSM